MPNCCNAKLLQGRVRQARKNCIVYLVLARKCGFVLFRGQGSVANPRHPSLFPLASNDRPAVTTCLGRGPTVLVSRVVKGRPWPKPGSSRQFSRRT
jgi:hypothetical protein